MTVQKRILVFAGSIRTGAFSGQLAAHVARELAVLGAEANLISLADYEMPIYDADREAREGQPENAKKLRAAMAEHHGIYIVTPEYNASVPPLLKNTIDWVSRVREKPDPYKSCVFSIAATSDGRLGGYRALMNLRQILELGLGALVLPEQVSVAGAGSAFDERGALKDERTQKMLVNSLQKLIDVAGKLP